MQIKDIYKIYQLAMFSKHLSNSALGSSAILFLTWEQPIKLLRILFYHICPCKQNTGLSPYVSDIINSDQYSDVYVSKRDVKFEKNQWPFADFVLVPYSPNSRINRPSLVLLD